MPQIPSVNKVRRRLYFPLRQYLLKPKFSGAKLKHFLGQDLYFSLLAYPKLGYWPDIKNPRTFNEHILYRQVYTNDPRFAVVEGKLSARDIVEDRIGDSVLPKLHFQTTNPEEIPFDELPQSFVVKPTHGSGGDVLLIEDKTNWSKPDIIRKCKKWMDPRVNRANGQYWYEEIKQMILIEEYLGGGDSPPRDFKFYVFHGQSEYIHVDFDRFYEPKRRFFDREWAPQEFRKGGVPLGPAIDRPTRFEEMRDVAESLGSDFDFIRVDIYQLDDDQVVFGEFTVGPAHGRSPFSPSEYDYTLGELW